MSYRCGLCNAMRQPGAPRLVHQVKRPNGQIVREIPVCPACQAGLARGTSPDKVAARAQQKQIRAAAAASNGRVVGEEI